MKESELFNLIMDGYILDPWGPHGVAHWARMCELVEIVAPHFGVDSRTVRLVRLFAMLHDARRVNDGHDPQHGARGAALARQIGADALGITPAELALLCFACEAHTDGITSAHPVVGACWDLDRLDLPRVSMLVNPALLSTPWAVQFAPMAKQYIEARPTPALIFSSWASDHQKAFALLPPEAQQIVAPHPGFTVLNRISPVWGNSYSEKMGVSTEQALFTCFGHATALDFLQTWFWHDGPLWYHGTSLEFAERIRAQGFVATNAGHRFGGSEPLGGLAYFGGPEQAALYGEAMVVVRFRDPVLLWNDARCVAARRAIGIPNTFGQALHAPVAQRQRLAESMRTHGVTVVRHDAPLLAEAIVYDLSAITVEYVGPTREMVPEIVNVRRRMAEASGNPAIKRPANRPSELDQVFDQIIADY